MDVAFSDFGAPVMWYFNSVWHAELSDIGQPPVWHWYMIICDGMVSLAVLAVVGLPLFRLIYRRSHDA